MDLASGEHPAALASYLLKRCGADWSETGALEAVDGVKLLSRAALGPK